ncbi:MAG: flagellar hook-basal body complex protein FliE [Cellvibrionaceae bacterium]|nr:flagellar hook-basal body complex protein FliE [Cellvibrionaceae bacterium]|tara:strand:- start:20080 stop:20457 length:378 start_codon:yes stop_codon:yes gene_type:complete
MTDRVDINRLLVEMRSLKTQSQGFQRPEGLAAKDVADVLPGRASNVKGASEVPSFGDMLEQAVNKVNDVQKASSSMATAYEMGDPNVDVTDVMVASQKASVSFQSMLQVRNKLIDAYRDVMNMPV